MLKRIGLGVLVCVLACLHVAVQAQDTAITAGEPVHGEITDEDYAIFYTYEGHKDDVIVIEMTQDDYLGDLTTPAIIIRDGKGRDLVRLDGFVDATLVTQLPEDDKYTIVTTRQDDAAGTSVGTFTLLTVIAQDLKIGDSASGRLDSESPAYYTYRQDEDFSLSFTWRVWKGQFFPEVTLNTINDEYTPGALDTLLTVSGDLATHVTLDDLPGRKLYVIKIKPINPGFDPSKAEYTLQMSETGK